MGRIALAHATRISPGAGNRVPGGEEAVSGLAATDPRSRVPVAMWLHASGEKQGRQGSR
jgi:hypothetical protein